MLSYEIYRLLHFTGLFLTILALGSWLHAHPSAETRAVRLPRILHGVGLFLVLLGGFGMLARLGLSVAAAPWIWLKLLVWAGFGAVSFLPKWKPRLAWTLWLIVPALGLVAVWAVMARPWS